MKKVIIAFAAALAVLSACEKTPALPVVQFDKANYILPADEPVTVKVVSDAAITEEVSFTVGGTAVKDADYTISVEKSVAFADAVEASVVITPLNNLEDKNIVLELSAKAGSYTIGQNAKTTIVITPKEKVYCSFTNAGTRLSGTTEKTISLKLVGATTGDKFKTSGELKIPFTVSGTAKEGTDFEIVGGEKYLVAADGTNVATVKIKSKYETAPETLPTLTFTVAAEDGRFLAGVNNEISIVFGGVLTFPEIAGKWSYSSYPLHDDEEADRSTFEMLIFDAGDTWETNIPWKNTASDVIEFKTEDGVNKLAVSGTGDIFDFLTDAEVTGIESHPYTWYYYVPERPWDSSVEIHLSKVNSDFSASTQAYKEGIIIVNLSDDGKTLDLIIPAIISQDPETSECVDNFVPKGDYFKGVYAYEDGLIWDLYKGDLGGTGYYWDQYYVFTKVTE